MLHDGVFLYVCIVSHVCESKDGLYVNVKLHFYESNLDFHRKMVSSVDLAMVHVYVDFVSISL